MSKLWRGPVGRRFTILYAAVFLASGTALLALTYLLSGLKVTTQAVPTSGVPASQQRLLELEQQLAAVHDAQSRQLFVGSLIALLIMAVISVLLGRFLSTRVLRPLTTVTAATRRISAANLHERLAVKGPVDEVKDLADTIDDLLERLESSFAAQRRFVANASHELRTPLTTMRASLDVALAKPDPIPAATVTLAGRLRGELDQIDRLLEGLLVLARAQHGKPAELSSVSLPQLVAAALAARAEDISARELTVDTDLAAAAAVGNATLLARMVQNVIDNAVVHNEPGGWIRVTTAKTGLVVENGGPVLDPAQVARLGQPFQRLGTERVGSSNGSGLGLSIVSGIAEAHGGRLQLQARREGGLSVHIGVQS